MGFFNRVSTIFKSNVNAALDQAEDPEKMLNQITNEMQEQLVKVKQQVATAIAQEKRLQKDYENEQEQADSLGTESHNRPPERERRPCTRSTDTAQ